MAYYSENIGCLHTASHGAHLGLSYLIYGEPMLIIIQNLAIIELIWKVDATVTLQEKIKYTLFVGLYGCFLFSGMVPEFAWSLITGTTIFFIALSRIPQIYGNYKQQSTGQLAFATFFVNFLRSTVRVLSVFAESSDWTYRLTYSIAYASNVMLVIQFYLYWNNHGPEFEAKQAQAVRSLVS
jgi:hypothetical protein